MESGSLLNNTDPGQKYLHFLLSEPCFRSKVFPRAPANPGPQRTKVNNEKDVYSVAIKNRAFSKFSKKNRKNTEFSPTFVHHLRGGFVVVRWGAGVGVAAQRGSLGRGVR